MRTFKVEQIVVATDLSSSGIVGLRCARLFAERFSAALTVLYVDPILLSPTGIGIEMPFYVVSEPPNVRDYADRVLRGLPYRVATVAGQPAERIAHELREVSADLVVMATHGVRGWQRLIAGSVTEGVMHLSDVPVLSVSAASPADRPLHVTKILCPIDFSDAARDALDYAAHVAGAFDAEVVVVHIASERTVTEKEIRDWVRHVTPRACSVRALISLSDPADRVIDCAEDIGADLLVVGAHHKWLADETTIGATTQRLVRCAPVPVLAVPHPVEKEADVEVRELVAAE